MTARSWPSLHFRPFLEICSLADIRFLYMQWCFPRYPRGTPRQGNLVYGAWKAGASLDVARAWEPLVGFAMQWLPELGAIPLQSA